MRKKKHPWGRPSKISDEIVQKLEEIFKIDWTVEEACWYAWISVRTFYYRCEVNEEFLHKMDRAKQFPFILARKVLMKSMTSKNEKVSLKAWTEFLSRREPRYSNKNTEIQKPYEPDKDEVERERIQQLLEKRYWKDE